MFFTKEIDNSCKFRAEKNIYERVAKRECKFILFYMDKQTKTVQSCDLIIFYPNSCRVLMSF